MRLATLMLILAIQMVMSARAQEGACPDTCPEGYVRSVETGECVPIAPMV